MYEQNIEYYAPEEKLAQSITVQAAEDKDCDEISAWAQKELARKYQVYAKRDKNYYERLLKELACEDGKLIIYRKDGQIVDVRPYYEESKETEEVEKKGSKTEDYDSNRRCQKNVDVVEVKKSYGSQLSDCRPTDSGE